MTNTSPGPSPWFSTNNAAAGSPARPTPVSSAAAAPDKRGRCPRLGGRPHTAPRPGQDRAAPFEERRRAGRRRPRDAHRPPCPRSPVSRGCGGAGSARPRPASPLLPSPGCKANHAPVRGETPPGSLWPRSGRALSSPWAGAAGPRGCGPGLGGGGRSAGVWAAAAVEQDAPRPVLIEMRRFAQPHSCLSPEEGGGGGGARPFSCGSLARPPRSSSSSSARPAPPPPPGPAHPPRLRPGPPPQVLSLPPGDLGASGWTNALTSRAPGVGVWRQGAVGGGPGDRERERGPGLNRETCTAETGRGVSFSGRPSVGGGGTFPSGTHTSK